MKKNPVIISRKKEVILVCILAGISLLVCIIPFICGVISGIGEITSYDEYKTYSTEGYNFTVKADGYWEEERADNDYELQLYSDVYEITVYVMAFKKRI